MHVKFQIKMLVKNVIPTARSNDLGMRLEWLLYKMVHIHTYKYVRYKHDMNRCSPILRPQQHSSLAI